MSVAQAGDANSSMMSACEQPRLNNSTNEHHHSTTTSYNAKLGAEESDMDEELLRVPDLESQPSLHSAPTVSTTTSKRPRGRTPADKEYRRLKRLLRNRVSAQQARERKKVYVNDLESRALHLQHTNSKLEEQISTLINENTMLRKVLMNTRPKVDQSVETKPDDVSS